MEIQARQHARRIQEKLGIDEGLIYIAGQAAKNNEESDMPAPFRQRRYFYYLTGCVNLTLQKVGCLLLEVATSRPAT